MVTTTTDEPMDRRIAHLALARFRITGFAGTSIADLASTLGISKAAIYYHYRSKDALLHHLIDPLLDAIDTCIHHHPTPRHLLDAYLAVLLTHREAVPLITTDPAVLHHPTIGPRLQAQHQQLHCLLAAPNTTLAASLRAEAALGAIRRPLIAEPQLDLTDPAHQHILIDAAAATLQPSQPTPNGTPLPGPPSNPHTESPDQEGGTTCG